MQGPAHCLRSSLRGRLWLQDPVGRGWGRGFWVMGAGTQRALEKVELRQRAACSQGAGPPEPQVRDSRAQTLKQDWDGRGQSP